VPAKHCAAGLIHAGRIGRNGQLLASKDGRAEEVCKEVEYWLKTVGMLK
jgi:hypothetical protein